MATNRDLLKEAIADAKAVKETAIANAKAALEEAFTPYLKEKLSAKLNEMDEEMYEEAEETNEMMTDEKDMMGEEISLDELLAELDSEDESLYEAKDEEGEEEEIAIEDMDENDLKSFIEDVIKDMVSAGELEAGHEGMENEEGAENEEDEEEIKDEEEDVDIEEINIDELLAEMEVDEYKKFRKATDPSPKSKNAIYHKGRDEYHTDKTEEDDAPYSKSKATKVSFMDEELDELTAAQSGAMVSGDNAAIQAIAKALDKGIDWVKKNFNSEELKQAFKNIGSAAGGATSTGTREALELSETIKTIKTLKSELNEINLLNAKLLYTNKIFRNKSLTESQKVKVLTAFDKATSKKEVELVYETLTESLRVSTTKAPIKESMGFASKALGGVTSKPIIENDAFSRMRELAFGNKK